MNLLSATIPAVVLDWAGTTIDHGCLAPVAALRSVLAHHGFSATDAEARGGMGLAKKDHLRALLAIRGAAEATDELYPELEYEIFRQLERHGELIAGAKEFAAWLRGQGVRIGSSTGYTREMMRVVAVGAARQGYAPDIVVTPDDVPAGRPAPLMMYANALRLGAWPLSSVVKIGDTPSDIAEGRNAGAWTIGVALTGNAFGLSVAETSALAPEERAKRAEAARATLRAAGAHEVVDSIADCAPVIERIAGAIRGGALPQR
jgi:phosphonoacetaldehyde hydrolase